MWIFYLCEALVEASLLGYLAALEAPETIIIAVFCLFIMSCDGSIGACTGAGLLASKDEETPDAILLLLFCFLGQNTAD